MIRRKVANPVLVRTDMIFGNLHHHLVYTSFLLNARVVLDQSGVGIAFLQQLEFANAAAPSFHTDYPASRQSNLSKTFFAQELVR